MSVPVAELSSCLKKIIVTDLILQEAVFANYKLILCCVYYRSLNKAPHHALFVPLHISNSNHDLHCVPLFYYTPATPAIRIWLNQITTVLKMIKNVHHIRAWYDDLLLFTRWLLEDDSQHTCTPLICSLVQWVFERISGVRLHISAERHYFFPQFLLAEIWVFDLFKMQSDSSTPESEREAHDCATKFEGLNAVTHREGELFCTCWSRDLVTGIQ